MPLMSFSLQHGRTLDEARGLLQKTVHDVTGKFGMMFKQVDWSPNRDAVKLSGTGFLVNLKVDPQAVHVTADFPGLSSLLAGPLTGGLKKIVEGTFQKRLT